MHRGERKRSRKLSKALTQPAQRERCGRGGDSFPESCPEPPGRGWGWPADRGGTAGAAPYLPPPPPPQEGPGPPATLISRRMSLQSAAVAGRITNLAIFVFCFSSLCGLGPCTWTAGGGGSSFVSRERPLLSQAGTMTWRTSVSDGKAAADCD